MELSMSRKEALEFKKRWMRINEAEKKELQNTSLCEKISQLAVLMSSAKVFVAKTGVQVAENNKIRDRWNCLIKAYNA